MKKFTPNEVIRHFPDAVQRTYQAGQIVVYDGDAPHQVMFIKSGAVKFYDIDADGNEKIMHIGGPGSIFPLFYSFEDKESVDAFYATISKTEVYIVPLEEFHRKLKTDANYTFDTLRWYAREMEHIVLRLKSMEKSSAKHKLLQALYYLSDQHSRHVDARSPWYRINFPVTQQTLADLTGLTRETVNVTLKDPECAKIIRNRRQIFEINRAKAKTAIEG